MIKLILLDLDGTLTDAGIYLGNNQEEFKKFSIKDGLIIKHVGELTRYEFGVITGSTGTMIDQRTQKLKIQHVYKGINDKVVILNQLLEKLSLNAKEIAYMGDDLNDLKIMQMVGLKGCPKDAAQEIIEIVDFVSTKKGGQGAVREFVEYIMKMENEWTNFLNLLITKL